MDLVEEIAGSGLASVLETAQGDDAALEALVGWLAGERLSARADEPELRVRTAYEARDTFEGLGVFDRLLAQAILALPPDHEQRDVGLARTLLDDHLAASRADGEAEEELRTITALLGVIGADPGAEALIERGATLADPEEDPGGAADFQIEAGSYCTGRYIDARDAGDEAAAERWRQRSTDFMATGEDLGAIADLAAHLDIAERWPEAADAYRRLIDATGLDEAPVQMFAIREGELRLMLGDAGAAAGVLDEALGHIEARYLDALRDEDVADAATALARAVDCLAIAQGVEEQWSALCRTLDRTRGLRLRQAAELRGRADLLDLERRIQAALRGAPDSPPPAELLEAYRRLRPDATEGLASPDGDALAAALAPGEAAAFVAHHFTGTVVAIAVGGGGVEGFLRDDVTTADWILAFADGDDGPGWIEMLSDPAAATPGVGLARLIGAADRAVGAPLRELLDRLGVCRVTMLVEDILGLIPWWALPSLEPLEVLAAGSAAEFLRAPAAAAPRTALVVSDPTLDLPVTAAACAQVYTALAHAGLDTTALAGREATEPSVLAALDGRTLLHFGGHGRSDVAYSALELQPDPPLAADPFAAWLAEADAWRTPEEDADEPAPWEHRWADLPQRGRLHERRWLASGRVDRWLEHATGTVAATYRDGACLRVSELWSASDLLVGDAVRDCRLAVLTACESATSGRGEQSRTPGLPAGLAFAGVDTVVGALWPVDEALAALWAQAFYAGLAEELGEGPVTVNVVALVHAAAAQVRGLSRAAAAGRLLALAETASNPIARFLLEADAAELDDPPFAEPHHWAAFYVTGRPTVAFA